MSVLENAVANLANALESLETNLERRRTDQDASGDEVDASRRQARSARGHTKDASRVLNKSIADLKALLAEPDPDPNSQDAEPKTGDDYGPG